MEVAQASEASSFGKYTLVAKLATGGMAEIFLARLLSDGGFEKLVCIKRILPHLAKDPQFVAMFLDEARVVARISHPNVCQVFELGEISGQYYIAMEYLAGVPLSAFRRVDYYPAPPEPRLIAGFGMQACEGLHHAHQLKAPNGEMLGVVHRDISPQNLFVTLDGIVKVLDFGIAKVQDQSVRTSTGAVKGTYCYMAPEQLRGEKVDRRADVWALGTVLWESLAQRHLFKRETEFLTFQAITTDPIPDICELRPDVPPLLGDTIARSISRDRDQRFPTARAFGEALAQAVGPLGGVYGAAAIAEEIETSFVEFLSEQRNLLESARAGDTFDLDQSNPLGGNANVIGATPVSNIRGKLAAAQAEVAQYVRAQAAIRSLEDDEPSSSGFTPPPGWRAGSPQRVQRRSRPMETQDPDEELDTIQPNTPVPRRQSAPMRAQLGNDESGVVVRAAPVKHSKLPWIIALVAVAIAGAAAAMMVLNTNKHGDVAAPPPPPAGSAVVMTTSPPIDAGVAMTVHVDAAVVAAVPIDATEDTAAPADAAVEVVKKKPIVKVITKDPVVTPPAEKGPPGYITIDSTPVYAVIFIDGKRYGETPLVKISLSPGKHSVKAVSPSGSARTLSIAIESGKVAPVRRIEW